jgi:hypothetical protein
MADTLDGNETRTSVKTNRKSIAFFNIMSSSRMETYRAYLPARSGTGSSNLFHDDGRIIR